MKIPDAINKLSIYEDHDVDYPYPPSGWLPFWEHELGNGDMYGFYWPLGKEDKEPLVIEMWHDSWEMSPEFSSAGEFMRASTMLEDDHGRPDPKESGDTKSPVVLFELANNLVASGDVEGAIKHLNTSLEILPEYTKAMGLLVSQYRRARDADSAIYWCLKAMRSPMSFGRINEQLPIWFSRQKEASEAVKNDPLWKRRTDITWKFGGIKENNNYRVLQEIIEEYADMRQWKNWFNLSQVYSELMCCETGAFQERYEFNPKEWRINQVDTYREKTGVDRNVLRQYKAG